MSYQHVQDEPSRRQPDYAFRIWRCYYCRALLVLRAPYHQPPARCGVCKR